MDNRITTQDVTIGEQVYQVRKMDPRTACWLYTMLGARSNGGSMLIGLGRCTHAEFDEVQGVALGVVSRLDTKDGNTFPMPIVGAGGVLADPVLAANAKGLFDLTGAAVMFSLMPFLDVSESSSPPPAQ